MTAIDAVPHPAPWAERLIGEVGRTVVGHETTIQRILIAALTGGHVLIEGLPGLAKTLAAHATARASGLSFQRVQFTPDLLPADITGTLIYDPQRLAFVVHRGPIFAHVVLADEINRAPAKVQSALLEAMQEGAVTIGRETHRLPAPFVVLATQNPHDHEGTYPLPEAQLDRFLFKLCATYPTREHELEIMRRHLAPPSPAAPPSEVVTAATLLRGREALAKIYVDDTVIDYTQRLAAATRRPAESGVTALQRHGPAAAHPDRHFAARRGGLAGGRARRRVPGRPYVRGARRRRVARA
jgi:MoxR-like ATPase